MISLVLLVMLMLSPEKGLSLHINAIGHVFHILLPEMSTPRSSFEQGSQDAYFYGFTDGGNTLIPVHLRAACCAFYLAWLTLSCTG